MTIFFPDNLMIRKFFFNFSLIVPAFIFILDRISKIYVINLTKNSFDIELYTSKFLNITLVWNEGIAFGLFSESHEYWYNFLTIVIVFRDHVNRAFIFFILLIFDGIVSMGDCLDIFLIV